MKDSKWVKRNGVALANCPSRVLAVGKHKGEYLDKVCLSYQRWTQSIGYPESLFVKEDTQVGDYCEEVTNSNYYGHNNI